MEDFGHIQNNEFTLSAKFNNEYFDVTFTVDKKMVDKIKNNFHKAQKKYMKMNGFRKGHVPKSIMEKKLGGAEKAYSASFVTYANAKIMEYAPHKLIHTYDFDVKYHDNGWCKVTCKTILEPPAEIKEEYLDMNFQIPKLSADEYVKYRMEAFARMHPYLRLKEDESGNPLPAAEDDMVEVSVDAFLDDEKFEQGSHDATNIRLVPGGVRPESLYNKLLGTSSGASFSIVTTNPEEIPSSFKKDFEGKSKFEIKVKINHVYRCEDPDIDDELAITAGYESLEDWKQKLIEHSNRIMDGRENQLKRSLVLEHIENIIPYPEFSDAWVESHASELINRGHKDTEHLRSELKKVAKQNTLLKKIGEYLGIEWDEEDANKSIYERDEHKYAETVLLKLIERANFVYVDPGTKEEGEGDREIQATGS